MFKHTNRILEIQSYIPHKYRNFAISILPCLQIDVQKTDRDTGFMH